MKKTTDIPIGKIELNNGQIEGLPKNPRFIRDERYKSLVKSIQDAPEMLELRELLVYPHGGKYVVIGGNMRLRACRELKHKEIPCKVLDENTPAEKLREYAMKDNIAFGDTDWDIIANEWDEDELANWGMEIQDDASGSGQMSETERLSGLTYEPLYYQPKEIPKLKLEDCINFEKFNAKLKALDEYELPEETKEMLKMFACRFIKIDFEAVANYYYFNAGEEEKKAIERLRLVLTDNGANGFIEDDMLRLADEHRESVYFDDEEEEE